MHGIKNLTNLSRGQHTRRERAECELETGMGLMASHLAAMFSGNYYTTKEVGNVFSLIREFRSIKLAVTANG